MFNDLMTAYSCCTIFFSIFYSIICHFYKSSLQLKYFKSIKMCNDIFSPISIQYYHSEIRFKEIKKLLKNIRKKNTKTFFICHVFSFVLNL